MGCRRREDGHRGEGEERRTKNRKKGELMVLYYALLDDGDLDCLASTRPGGVFGAFEIIQSLDPAR